MKLKLSEMFLHVRRSLIFALPLLALMLVGCGITPTTGVNDPPDPTYSGIEIVPRLHIGDSVIITFEGPQDMIAPHEETIKEDGTVTLPYIGHVKAAGRTSGELQDEIRDKYVPKYYVNLTVTVKTGDRVFFVRGEVKSPGRQIYTGPISVTKAITSAGDFMDFASRRNVVLTRASGQRYVIDCVKILDGKKPDPGVYPGDQIEVKRGSF